MKTLIVPCCGNLAYGDKPAYLLCNSSGEMLLSVAVSGMDLTIFDRVIVVIPALHEQKWQATEKIQASISHENVDVAMLNHETAGPANTILEAIEQFNVQGSIVVKDADNYIKYNDGGEGNFVVGIDVYDYDGEIRNLKNKSFIVCNEQNQLLDVVEKRICSSQVCLGAYGFADVQDFVDAINALHDPIYDLKSLYVSEAITYLMGYKGMNFNYVVAADYKNWGNDYDLKDLMRDD